MDFQSWLLTSTDNSTATAAKRAQRLRYAQRNGLRLDAFQASQEAAADTGTSYLAKQRARLSASAYGNDARLLNVLARWCGWDLHWPTPRVARAKPPEYRLDELARLRAASWGRNGLALRTRAVHELNLATGLRRGELAALERDDIDADGYNVRVTTKHGRPRRLRWADPSIWDATALRAWWDHAGPGPLFQVEGSTLANIHWSWGRTVNVAASFQRGRRTFARSLKRQGVPAETIQVYLGHAKVDTTLTYIDLQDEGASDDMQRWRPHLSW